MYFRSTTPTDLPLSNTYCRNRNYSYVRSKHSIRMADRTRPAVSTKSHVRKIILYVRYRQMLTTAISHLKNKFYPGLYVNIQSVPRSKHTPSRL